MQQSCDNGKFKLLKLIKKENQLLSHKIIANKIKHEVPGRGWSNKEVCQDENCTCNEHLELIKLLNER